MIHGINSGSLIPPDKQDGSNYQALKHWEDELTQLLQTRGLNCAPYIQSIIDQLQQYTSGQKGYFNADQVMEQIKQTFFDSHGNQDLYMISGASSTDVGDNDIINKIMGVFGLQAPPPTAIDQVKMRLITETRDNPGFPFFNLMSAECDRLGSNGSVNQLMNWANDFATQGNYQKASPKYQEMFWDILNFYKDSGAKGS